MKLIEKIENIANLKLDKFPKDYKLHQLGLDSIKLAQIASLLEKKLDREISLKEMMEMTPEKLLILINLED